MVSGGTVRLENPDVALLDSIRGGPHNDEPRRVAIVWPDPHTMAGADDRDLAMNILGAIARDLADYRATVGNRPRSR